MEHYTKQHEETRDGFTITFSTCYEDMDPRGQFMDEEIPDILDAITSGRYEWFIAKVTASKNGVELSSDYLGGCLYESFSDFISPDDYYEDMVQRVIREAKETIKKLCEA